MSSAIESRPLLLAGRWADGSAGATMDVENPADESVVARVAIASQHDVETAVKEAVRAQRDWAATPAGDRAEVLRRLADLLERDRDRLASIVTSETGKPITEARGEVGGAIGFARFFAGIATTQGGEILPASGRDQELWVRRVPVGVVAGIVPWNFPLALTLRKLSPALVSGNAIILKPAEITPLSALAVAELAIEAGVPAGVLSVLPGDGPEVGGALVGSPDIAFVTMTGSVRTGRAILRDAAERIIPVSLELGGNAAFIVFDDTDVEDAVASAVATRMMNNGQACVCNERTYVHRSIFDDFVTRYAAALDALVMGAPTDDATQVGPKISRRELDNVERIVAESVAAGARVVTGGSRPSGPQFGAGYWYTPTLLTDLPPDAPALREEVFGPVTPVVPFDTEAEVIHAANDTSLGLSNYLYTGDFGRIMRMTRALQSGEVFVNRGGPEEVNGFHSGWGLSGLGGDDGLHGFSLYSKRQTVYVSWGTGR